MTSKKRFSRDFATFEEWLASTSASPVYKERIRKAFQMHPDISLNQARGHAGPREKPLEKVASVPVSRLPVEARTPRQEQKLRKARAVYWTMRNDGVSLEEAANRVGVSPEAVTRALDAFIKKRGRWHPKGSFSSPVDMHVVAEGKDRVLTIVSSEDASIIGKHHNAIKKFLETGLTKHLKPFRRRKVRDASGRRWLLETDAKALYSIMERREEPEFYSIYKE